MRTCLGFASVRGLLVTGGPVTYVATSRWAGALTILLVSLLELEKRRTPFFLKRKLVLLRSGSFNVKTKLKKNNEFARNVRFKLRSS